MGLVTLFAIGMRRPTQRIDRGRPRTVGRQGADLAMRSRIEIYWNSIETAPTGVAVQVRVTDGSSDEYLLPYPCKLTPDGWVNAATGSPLAVRPTYWKLYVETLPRKWKRKNLSVEQPGG
jgi:hypothetical protein